MLYENYHVSVLESDGERVGFLELHLGVGPSAVRGAGQPPLQLISLINVQKISFELKLAASDRLAMFETIS